MKETLLLSGILPGMRLVVSPKLGAINNPLLQNPKPPRPRDKAMHASDKDKVKELTKTACISDQQGGAKRGQTDTWSCSGTE